MANNTIILKIEGRCMECCKETLCTSSDYFKAMFSCNMKEITEHVIALNDVSYSAFELIWRYCKSSVLELNSDNVWDVVMTSQMLQFCDVLNCCLLHLKENLCIDNCISTMALAAQFSLRSIYSLTKSFILFHFQTVVKEKYICEIPFNEMINICSSEYLNIPSETFLFDALKTYLGNNSNRRVSWDEHSKKIKTLFQCVRYAMFDAKSLSSLLSDPVIDRYELRDEINNKILEMQGIRSCTRSYPERSLSVLDTTGKGGVVFEYDEKKSEVMEIIQLPIPKGTCGYQVCSTNQYLYVIGGELNRIGSGRWMTDAWRYDCFTSNWTQISQMPTPRRHHAMCCDEQGNLYVAGGFGRYRQKQQSVETLNTQTGEWSALPDLPDFIYKFTLIHASNTLYACYGYQLYVLNLFGDPSWEVKHLERVDTQASFDQSTSTHTQYPNGSVKHVFLDGKLYFVGNNIMCCDLNMKSCMTLTRISEDNFIPQLNDPFRVKMCVDATVQTYLSGQGCKSTDIIVGVALQEENNANVMVLYRQTLNSPSVRSSIYKDVKNSDWSGTEFQLICLPRVLDFNILD